MKMGRTGLSKEDFIKHCKRGDDIRRRGIDNFNKLVNDPEENMKAMEELERRKAANMDALRSYGFKV